MKKLLKPYAQDPNYNCFGCSPHNPIGLDMQFFDLGTEIECVWNPTRNYEGFHNILHGGIQSTLIDEIAAWCINIRAETSGVTVRMDVRYLNPVEVSTGEIKLVAKIIRTKRRVVTVGVQLFNSKGKKCTEGEVDYFTFSQDIAREKYNYPGKEAFYQ